VIKKQPDKATELKHSKYQAEKRYDMKKVSTLDLAKISL
jgi:hypothetical protein